MRKRNAPAVFTRRQPSGHASWLVIFLCKGQPLRFKGQSSHPKKYNSKGSQGQGGTRNRSFFSRGNLGNILWVASWSRGSSTAGIVQWGESGGRPGVERSGEGSTGPTPPPPPPPRVLQGAAARSGQRRSGGPGLASPWGPTLSRAEATAARFLGLGDGSERERERPPETTLGDAARRIDCGWELRARTFRKSTGASSGAAPPPPPARLPFRVVTQPAGYAGVGAESRNLPGRRPRLPAPAQPGAGDALRDRHFERSVGTGSGRNVWSHSLLTPLFPTCMLSGASLRRGK